MEISVMYGYVHWRTWRNVWYYGPANTRRWTNVDLMLDQSRRRWANSKSTLVQCIGFAGEDVNDLARVFPSDSRDRFDQSYADLSAVVW